MRRDVFAAIRSGSIGRRRELMLDHGTGPHVRNASLDAALRTG